MRGRLRLIHGVLIIIHCLEALRVGDDHLIQGSLEQKPNVKVYNDEDLSVPSTPRWQTANAPLRASWHTAIDVASGNVYHYNDAGRRQWTRPTVAPFNVGDSAIVAAAASLDMAGASKAEAQDPLDYASKKLEEVADCVKGGASIGPCAAEAGEAAKGCDKMSIVKQALGVGPNCDSGPNSTLQKDAPQKDPPPLKEDTRSVVQRALDVEKEFQDHSSELAACGTTTPAPHTEQVQSEPITSCVFHTGIDFRTWDDRSIEKLGGFPGLAAAMAVDDSKADIPRGKFHLERACGDGDEDVDASSSGEGHGVFIVNGDSRLRLADYFGKVRVTKGSIKQQTWRIETAPQSNGEAVTITSDEGRRLKVQNGSVLALGSLTHEGSSEPEEKGVSLDSWWVLKQQDGSPLCVFNATGERTGMVVLPPAVRLTIPDEGNASESGRGDASNEAAATAPTSASAPAPAPASADGKDSLPNSRSSSNSSRATAAAGAAAAAKAGAAATSN